MQIIQQQGTIARLLAFVVFSISVTSWIKQNEEKRGVRSEEICSGGSVWMEAFESDGHAK